MTGTYSNRNHALFLGVEGAEPELVDKAVDERARSAAHRVAIVVQRGVPAGLLRGAMRRTLMHGAGLELVGNRHLSKPAAPPPAWAGKFVDYLSESLSGVHLELRAEPACPACAGRATLGPGGLEVTFPAQAPVSWVLEEDDSLAEPSQQLDFEWNGTVEDLARASSIAFTHGALLSVSVAPEGVDAAR